MICTAGFSIIGRVLVLGIFGHVGFINGCQAALGDFFISVLITTFGQSDGTSFCGDVVLDRFNM